MSRFLLSAILAGATLAGFGASASAAQRSGPVALPHQAATMPVVTVAIHCGHGTHFVPRHRYHGHWVKPYCARNRHH
ncbi:MAG: hypothetical protein PHT60_02185 [Acidiphilium sp.]|nr:hypothetical protein [Acidiphilium sp.]MDD4934564.1 hypothetical protein [Acidiphilium sp.]